MATNLLAIDIMEYNIIPESCNLCTSVLTSFLCFLV